MGSKRFPQLSTGGHNEDLLRLKKRKTTKLEEQEVEQSLSGQTEYDDPKPIGLVVRVSRKGEERRNHYQAFEYDGASYYLEYFVLIVPEEEEKKPLVAIIKDITQARDGSMSVTGQRLYRPEEVENIESESRPSFDARELFYTFHCEEVAAESVMHKCVVHFVPLNKQLPNRREHPGFIVQKVYDTRKSSFFNLTDKSLKKKKQDEVDYLIQKTLSHSGELPDLEIEGIAADWDDNLRSKRILSRKNMAYLELSEDEEKTRFGQPVKIESIGSGISKASNCYGVLEKFKALTGETQRDRWLERLLQGIQFTCKSIDNLQKDDKQKGGSDAFNHVGENNFSRNALRSQGKSLKDSRSLLRLDAAVLAVTALEKVLHCALGLDFQKYNKKMEQLLFNLRNSALLARRLINKELEPLQILKMSPNELKEGLMAEEMAVKDPEQSKRIQMTDARCKRCREKKVCLTDIIQAEYGECYQLQCFACGYTWYVPRKEASICIQ